MYPYFQRQKAISKIGILVSDLRPSTRNYHLIETGNKIAKEQLDIDFYVFNEDWKVPSHTICFPLLQQRNAWAFDGILISTDIPTTRKLLALPDTCSKYFYIWDMMEWTTLKNTEEVLNLYSNDKISLIARSLEYSQILAQNFNTIPLVLEDFKYDSIIKLCKL